jgi:hypothetical protein
MLLMCIVPPVPSQGGGLGTGGIGRAAGGAAVSSARPASLRANSPRVAARRPYAARRVGRACFSRPIFCYFLPSGVS